MATFKKKLVTAVSFPATVLWTSRYEYRAKKVLSRHSHPFAQLIMVVKGRGVFHHNRNLYSCGPLDVLLALPGESHGLSNEQAKPIITLEIKFKIAPKFSKILTHLRKVFHADAAMHQLMAMIRVEGEKKDPFYWEQCNVLLCEFLLRRLRFGKSEMEENVFPKKSLTGDEACDTAINYIEAHHTKSIRLEACAFAAGLSYRQLSRRFQERLSLPLGEHLRRRRVSTAQELLRHSDLSCEAVSLQSGFETVAHFTRVFKKMTGLPPATWRRREKEGIRKDIILDKDFVDIRKADV